MQNNEIITKDFTCIVCPRGCLVSAELDKNNNIINISGYSCKRGLTYVQNELTSPKRTVTSTVKTEDNKIVSVRTNKDVPKSLIFDIMKEINSVIAPKDVKFGQILINNICGSDASLVVTSEKID